MTKYMEKTQLNSYRVRQACIDHRWYTAGDNRAYHNLFQRIYTEPYSQELLEWVAQDIIEHTPEDHDDFVGYGEDVMPYVLFVLKRECCESFFERKEA